MIDRTTFDLRIAEHRGAVARTNEQAWQTQVTRPVRATRAALARVLVALATRLAPEVPAGGRGGQPARRPTAA